MSFENLKLTAEIKDAIKRMNYGTATAVQTNTIPLMLSGKNVVVESHTGSGKTAAFGIPISDMIYKGEVKSALILCPTRELAVQVKDELRKINSKTGLNVAAFYGGHGMGSELREIRNGIDILCATPGRLLDHLRQRNLDARNFSIVVLDEADRMLDMGFIHDLRQILEAVRPKNIHLFSATLAGGVAELIHDYMPHYDEVILPEQILGKNIFEQHLDVPKERKLDELIKIIDNAKNERVLVFVATKRGADFVSRKLEKAGCKVSCIHGDKTQRAREFALKDFKTGRVNVMVATDVAARGLQIDNVEYVVNYDLANDADTHKHRIGRTGRMGKKGNAISFVGKDGSVIAPPKQFGRQSQGSWGRRGGNGRGRGNRGDSRNGYSGRNGHGDYNRQDSRGRRGNFKRRGNNHSERRERVDGWGNVIKSHKKPKNRNFSQNS